MLLGGVLPLVFVWPIILLLTFLILRYPLSTRPLQLAATLVTMALVAADGAVPAPWQRAQTLDKDLWGHVFFAQLLYGGGREVIEGDGYLKLPLFTAAFGSFAMLVAIGVHTVNMMHYFIEPPHHLPFFHLIHYIIFGAIFCIFVMAGLAHRNANGRPRRATSNRLSVPATLIALGVLFVFHLHELLPVPMRMHKNLGYTLVLIGVVQLCCIVAHEQVGWGAPCCHAMRQAHAFSWWLSATWLMVMALCLYTKDGETQTDLIGVLGQEASLASISPQKADEIVWSLFALTILITVVIVSLVAQRVDAAHEGEAASGEPPPRAGPVGAAPHALDPLERDTLIIPGSEV